MVTLPLVLLAIPSVGAGWFVGAVVYGNYFGDSLPPPEPNYFGIWSFIGHGFTALPFWLASPASLPLGSCTCTNTNLPDRIAARLGPLYAIVERKYGFDELYAWLFAGGARLLGRGSGRRATRR